ncbi:hypothetical protein PHSY_001953 [Pseudozyma hubeiensis SY62]|uniref:Uncharacterized protein n=1 Tax=Pseudozyma hubeiensis (strain SY62) TaxID=1305764 RepID=R9P066_PSEHS|nr:hypothetical protein PHSY_001953 [Pseudozyma hubeiensis SY62]GAC94382.1 hypothetical protein PHSY_001953 [Pseudozyma hubeiensis SY62]
MRDDTTFDSSVPPERSVVVGVTEIFDRRPHFISRRLATYPHSIISIPIVPKIELARQCLLSYACEWSAWSLSKSVKLIRLSTDLDSAQKKLIWCYLDAEK